MTRRVQVRVTGRVQGVGFRAYTQKQAMLLGLSGWVRNMADGSVEFQAEGGEEAIQLLIQRCQRGPLWARVEDMKVIDEPPLGENGGFAVRGNG